MRAVALLLLVVILSALWGCSSDTSRSSVSVADLRADKSAPDAMDVADTADGVVPDVASVELPMDVPVVPDAVDIISDALPDGAFDAPSDASSDIATDLPSEALPEDGVPQFLTVIWCNMDNMDVVTVKKRLVLEFPADTPMPVTPEETAKYNEKFPARLVEWDLEASSEVEEVPITVTWRPVQPGLRRNPSLVVQAVELLKPATPYKVSVQLGDKVFERVFQTLPPWSPGYKLVEFVVPVEECEKCFPYPVKIHVFIPPEYKSPDPEYDNTTGDYGNGKQRYPVLVGLHGYAGEGLGMADAYGWNTLPRFSIQGVLEPIILVLPDGTVPPEYCPPEKFTWPGAAPTCYTQFMGTGGYPPNFTKYTNYGYFMAHTMLRFVAQWFRVRNMTNGGDRLDDNGEIIDKADEDNPKKLLEEGRTWNYFRRSHGITGLSGGGFAALLNAFAFEYTWGSVYGLMPTTVSFFNPWSYYYPNGELPITESQVCNKDGNTDYPYEPVGAGFRDLCMIDPATGKTREITLDMREIKKGAKSCFWFTPPAEGVPNPIVVTLLCGLDVTCTVDPGTETLSNPWLTDFVNFPFDGNILFTTGIKDFEGPPAAFIDLDQQLDKQGIVHSFRYEDQGGVYHDWQAIYDQVVGRYEISWQSGETSPGNYPETGALYPFFNNAFEGIGNHPFNHPFASEFTTGALDPDRDFYIDLYYPPMPELNYVEDNCPGVPNPDQADSDGDGVGDACE